MNDERSMDEVGRIWAAYEDADTETKKQLMDHAFDFIIDNNLCFRVYSI